MLLAEFSALGRTGSFHLGLETFTAATDITDGSVDKNTFALPATYTVNTDLDVWRSFGANAMFYTAKHTSGFCLWDTAVHSYKVTATTFGTLPKRDLLSEIHAGLEARGMKKILYLSVTDYYLNSQLGYAYNSANYLNAFKAYLTEVLTSYGTVDAIFLDAWGDWWQAPNVTGTWVTFSDISYLTLYNHVKSLQPGCLIMVNNHDDTHGDIITCEYPIDGLRKSGATKPVYVNKPIQSQTPVLWFDHTVQTPISPNPAARYAKLAEHNALRRGYVFAHNASPSPLGYMRADTVAVLRAINSLPIPASWDRLLTYWPMGERSGTAVDWCTAATGDYTGVPAVNSPGFTSYAIGGARLVADATNDHFSRPAAAAYYIDPLAFGNRSFTFRGIATWTGGNANGTVILANDDDNAGELGGLKTQYRLYLSSTGGKVSFLASYDGTNATVVSLVSSYVAQVGVPFFFSAGHDADLNRLFLQVNGGAYFTADMDPRGVAEFGPGEGASPFTFGCRGTGVDEFTGSLRSVALFVDRAFTQADGLTHYNNGRWLTPFDTAMTIDILSDKVLHLKLNDAAGSTTAIDSSVNGWNAALTGGYALGVAGKRGTAMRFSADTAFCEVPDHVALGSTPLTVTGWVKLTALSDLQTFATHSRRGAPWDGWFFRQSGNKLNWLITVGGTDYPALSTADMTTGEWMFLAGTYDGETSICYLNAVAGTPNPSPSGAMHNPSEVLAIGNDQQATSRRMHGDADDWRVYNRVLTLAEITAIMRDGPLQTNRLPMMGMALTV